jgi:CRP-like cAMP-binding protein
VNAASPALRAHPLVGDLPEAHLARLETTASLVGFAAGETILKEGDVADAAFLIAEGRVSLEVHIPGRAAARVEEIGPGGLLGFSWLFPHARVHIDARALSRVSAVRLDGVALLDLMEAQPDLGYALSRKLLRVMFERLASVRLQRLDMYRAGS